MAQRLAADEGVELAPLYSKEAGGVTMVNPDMKTLDLWKRGMDAVVEKAYKKSGTIGASAKQVRDNFRDHLDVLVPDYKDVRGTYAGYSAAMEATEMGKKFMRSTMLESSDGVDIADVAKLGEHEIEAFRAGVASVIRDQLGNKPFGADVTKIFDRPAVHAKLKAVMGEEGANEFLSRINKEAQMAATYAETQGSQTAQRLATGQTMDRPAGLVSDVLYQNYGNLATRMADAVSTQPEATAKVLSGLLLSPDPLKQAMALKMMKSNRVLKAADVLSPAMSAAIASSAAYGSGRAQSPSGMSVTFPEVEQQSGILKVR
jgi:hypothetical protein